MPPVEWEEWMRIGLDRVDADHKHMLSLLTGLENLVQQGAAREKILAAFDDFVLHIKNHFMQEEELFNKSGFPGTAAHVREHQELLAQVLDLQNKIQSEAEPLNRDRLNFLVNWLVNHILTSDKKYAADPHVQALV